MAYANDEAEAYGRVFAYVMFQYRRRWWRWFFQPSWREMAGIDASHQAGRALRQAARRAEQARVKAKYG
jgi:hypothetical protein